MISKPHDKITFHDTVPHTEQWYEFREGGLGGSEVATIFGLNKYKSSARLFHEKVGTIEPHFIGNQYTLWGTVAEPTIRNMWKYWDGTAEGYIANYQNGRVMRTVTEVEKYFATHSDYPHLFASIDGHIDKGGFRLDTGEEIEKGAILEVKTMSDYVANMWEFGIPPAYIVQVHVYMLIYDYDYVEIAVLKGGNTFEVLPLERNNSLMEKIINLSTTFWEKVLKGRECFDAMGKATLNNDTEAYEDAQAMLDQLEPMPDDSDDYTALMKERFRKEIEVVAGGEKEETIARDYKLYHEVIKALTAKKTLKQNELMKILHDARAEEIELVNGKVTLREQKNGKLRFTNGLRVKFEEEVINGFVEGISV